MFVRMDDSLKLARSLFPEILQLTNIPEYKEPVNDLLINLLDSGLISSGDYSSYFDEIFFDARLEMKRLQIQEEHLLEKQTEKENGNADENEIADYNYSRYSSSSYGGRSASSSGIENYAALLMPFYSKDPSLAKMYNKLLQSRDTSVQLSTAVLLLKNNHPVADSIFKNMAAQDKYSVQLLDALEEIKRVDLFPAAYKKQVDMARSVLNNQAYSSANKPDNIEPAGRVLITLKGKKGYVYFFKYKTKDDEDWQIGLSGLQPENTAEVSSDDSYANLTDKKLTEEKPEAEQFNEQLKKIRISQHRSTKNFYNEGGMPYDDYDYED